MFPFGVLTRGFDRVEGAVASVALAAMAVLLLAEMIARSVFQLGIPGSGPIVQHLTLWVGFLGAALAAGEGRLLALATGTFLPEGRWRTAANIFSSTVATAVSALLCLSMVLFLRYEREAGTEMALGIPVWVAMLALPISFGLIALRLMWRAGLSAADRPTTDRPATDRPQADRPQADRPQADLSEAVGTVEDVESDAAEASDAAKARPIWWARAVAALGLGFGLWLGARLMEDDSWLWEASPWPAFVAIIVATLLGGPIFCALGGIALVFFITDGTSIAAVPVETYRLAVSPTLPAIPLFTLTGFLLAEGKASQRLIQVFRAFFGWIPGGTAVVTAVVCAFFTVFTGGSGVTILALGGLLFQALQADRYRENFSLGLLTASGSLGLLLPPALPLILYGIVAEVSIEDLFLGGVFPGLLLVTLIAAWGMREGIVTGAGRTAFAWPAARQALWVAKWELFLPVFLLTSLFSGWVTVVETSALAVAYAFIVQCFIHRDLSVRRDLLRVLRQCVVLIGGVLIILGVAMGLVSYLVDAQVPATVLEWVQSHIESKLVFLLALNVFLLLVGCLMDIFSAIVVVVPLIVPLGVAYGIDPIHLGIIFVANLELGYLTPPVGLNLFLASYRFERPLMQIYRAAIPMLIILAIGVLLITYVPFLTTGIFGLLGRGGG